MNENATEVQKPKVFTTALLVFLMLFLLFSVTMSVVLGLALGVGYCLSKLIPGIELPHATIIALLAQFTVLFVALKLFAQLPFLHSSDEDQDQSEEDHDEDFTAEFATEVAEQIGEAIMARSEFLVPMQPTTLKKRRRLKTMR